MRLSRSLWPCFPSAEMSVEAVGPGLDGGRGLLVQQCHTALYSLGASASQVGVNRSGTHTKRCIVLTRNNLYKFFSSCPLALFSLFS